VSQTEVLLPTLVDPHVDNPHHEKRWLILGVLALAQLMVVLDTTVVNIALPSAQKALHFSNDDRQWIVTAYSLAFGSLLLLGGRLSDLLGRKRVLMIGMVGFAIASAIGGAATSFAMLAIARAIQGAFGALLAPAALSVLTTTFTEPTERAKAFGIYGAIAGGGAAVGLLLGGVLTEYLSWRYCMFVNLIFAAVAFVGASTLLHNRKDESGARLDVPGTVVVSLGLFCLVYGFSHASTTSWSDVYTIGFLVASALLLAAFVMIEARVADPLLPLKVLESKNRSGAYASIFISGVGMFGVFLFLTYYLQVSLGYSAVGTGVSFLPMVGMLVLVSIFGQSVLATRVGPKWTVGVGMLLAAAALAMLTRIGIATPWATHVLPALLVLGAGLGLVFSSALSLSTAGVDPEHAGVASALVNVGQQVGGSVGTALLNTIETTAVTAYLVAHRSTSKLVEAHAAVHGYVTAFWWSAAIFAVGVLVAGALLSARVPEGIGDTEVVAL
jgi:EmrB/QacA subfamily drug resistance transporter